MDFKNSVCFRRWMLAAGELDMPGVLSVFGSFSMFRGQNLFFYLFFFEGKDDLFLQLCCTATKLKTGLLFFVFGCQNCFLLSLNHRLDY